MNRFGFRQLLTVLGPFFGLLFVVGIFSIKPEVRAVFLTGGNCKIIFTQTVIVAIGALGMTMIIISGGIDLSVGSAIALTSVVTAVALHAGWSPVAAILAAIAIGGLVGMINGIAITSLRVVPFIATLGMLGIARGAAKWVADQQTVNAPATWINELAVTFPSRPWMLFAPGVWLTVFLAIVMTLVLRNTIFGRRVFALGSNEAAARAVGIRTNRFKIWIYTVAGAF